EIFEIAERVTVFRDGGKVGVYEPKELDREKLIFLMTGEQVLIEPPEQLEDNREELLCVRGLSKHNNFKDISFSLRKGEILGITGRLGSGRTEMALSLFGMNPPDEGEIRIGGKKRRLRNNISAVKAGIAYVPENRLKQGLIMPHPIASNMTLTILKKLLNKSGLLDFREQEAEASRWVKELAIKIPSLEAPVQTLSGGNQQKVVLSKWLSTQPKILILDEPTVGIDVLAKNSVHDYIKKLALEGIGIILISDEVHEVLSNCHRVLIMDGGRIIDEVMPGPNAEEVLLERFNLA
ncbi:MAG: lipase, partial [Spirochaeta sp. LUC14_002_19_P3]